MCLNWLPQSGITIKFTPKNHALKSTIFETLETTGFDLYFLLVEYFSILFFDTLVEPDLAGVNCREIKSNRTQQTNRNDSW